MKRAFILSILCFSLFLISCSQKKKKQPEIISPIQKSEKKVSIASIGGIQFTRSYSEIQSMTDKKKIDEYLRRQERSNPGYMAYKSDSIFKGYFQKLGLVTGNELLLSKFKHSSKTDTSIIDPSGKGIKIHFERDLVSGIHDKITIFNGADSSQVRAVFHQKIEYAFLDVIQGGNKELVVLTEDYLMNTEIYTFEVFEIKNKD